MFMARSRAQTNALVLLSLKFKKKKKKKKELKKDAVKRGQERDAGAHLKKVKEWEKKTKQSLWQIEFSGPQRSRKTLRPVGSVYCGLSVKENSSQAVNQFQIRAEGLLKSNCLATNGLIMFATSVSKIWPKTSASAPSRHQFIVFIEQLFPNIYLDFFFK